MKAKMTIFTHAGVFAMGAAIVFFAREADHVNRSGTMERAGSGSSSARGDHSVSSDAGDPLSAGRERRSGSNRTSRSNETPVQRLAGIARIGDPLERQEALMELVRRLGPDQFAAVAEQFRELDHYGNSRGEYDIILRGWAKVDPLAALEYTALQPDNGGQTALVLSTWAGSDAAAAERWAMEHHDGEGANPYLTAVIRGIAAYDLANASRLAESMPFGRERGEAVEAITRALFVQGADAAMAYPASIQDPQLRAGFVAAIAGRLAGKDAQKAADWLSGIPDAEAQSRSARHVAEALAAKDTATAASWLRTLKPEAQAEAARGIIPNMSSSDIAGTANWVSSLNGIPNYDRVVEEFVWSCDRRAPEQSAAWIQGIADEAQRSRLYHRMLGEWARRDPNAVGNWVAANHVPPSVANRFRK